MRDTPNFLIWLNIYIIKNVGRVYLLIRTGAARKPNWKVLGKKGNFLPLSKFPNTKGCRNAASARAKANSIRVATWKVSPGVLRGTHRQLRQVTESCQSLGMQTGGFSRRFTPPPPKHFALTFHFPRLFGISPEVRPRNYSEFSSLWFWLEKESQCEQPRPLVKPFSCRREKQENYADSTLLHVKIFAHICATIFNIHKLLSKQFAQR